ncbi:hypothetical protein KSF78_0000650 [Schistosoma japonicum]|nr:hypothetical protein KSF78_0000650 [Schistosoma japonicum]
MIEQQRRPLHDEFYIIGEGLITIIHEHYESVLENVQYNVLSEEVPIDGKHNVSIQMSLFSKVNSSVIRPIQLIK